MTRRPSIRALALVALLVAVMVAAAAAPFAASAPDGLERVAQDAGFADAARPHALAGAAPAPDYAAPGVEDARVATALAGVAGTLAVFALTSGVVLAARRRRGPGVRG